jgi:hypothetical protein
MLENFQCLVLVGGACCYMHSNELLIACMVTVRWCMVTFRWCDPCRHERACYAALCAEASSQNAYGASLLNLLHSRAKTEAGNVSKTQVLRMLLKAASVPYFEVLTTWVSTGTLKDPFSEFMVVAVPGMNVDVELDGQPAFWVGGHTLRTVTVDGTEHSDVPMFLHAVEEEVLNAGAGSPAWNDPCMYDLCHAVPALCAVPTPLHDRPAA